MKKSELVDQVAKGAGVAKRQTEKVLDAFFETAKKAAKKGDEVSWPKFGVVEAAKKAGKTAGKKAGKLASSKKGVAKQAVTKVVEKVDKVVHVPGLRPDEPPAAEPATAEPATGDQATGDQATGPQATGPGGPDAPPAASGSVAGGDLGGPEGGAIPEAAVPGTAAAPVRKAPAKKLPGKKAPPTASATNGPHGQEVARRPKVPGQEGRDTAHSRVHPGGGRVHPGGGRPHPGRGRRRPAAGRRPGRPDSGRRPRHSTSRGGSHDRLTGGHSGSVRLSPAVRGESRPRSCRHGAR